MEGKIRIVISVIIVFLMISIGIIPAITASRKEIENNNIEIGNVNKIPEYIEIIKYNFRGISYTEEIINMSYSEAMIMKHEFETLENDKHNESFKFEMKKNILEKYNIIKNSNQNDSYISGNNVIDQFQDTALIMANIEGFFGPSIINLISFLIWSPIFSATSLGINAKYESMLGPGEVFTFTSNKLVLISFLMFFGALIVFPFISPGGYLNGFTFLGVLQELL